MPEPHPDPEPGSPTPAGPASGTVWRRPITVGFAIVAGLVGVLLVVLYRPFLHPILWAAALATLLYPAHRRVLDLVGGRANLAAAASTILSTAVVVAPSILALDALVSEARDLWPRLTSQVGGDAFARLAAFAEESPLGRGVHLALQVPPDAGAAGLESRFRALVEALVGSILQGVRGLTLGAPGALLQLGITLVILFFFLRQGPGWARRLRDALPLPPADADALLDTAARTVGAVFRGVLLTALAQASLATAGYFVAGVPVPVLLGFVTLVSALLPFLGAGLVWGATAIGLVLDGRTGAAIGLAIWGALVVSLIDNFLKPYLIGRGSRLPMLWLFLAILGGLKTFGVLGLLVGPAALALFIACYRIYAQQLPSAAPPAPGPRGSPRA